MKPLTDDAFERLVAEALDSLPEDISRHMDNVEVVIEDRPDAETAPEDRGSLLGLYYGIPLTERGNNYFGVLPDRITLYKNNIEHRCRNESEVRDAVRMTVIHEIAHHFGIDDDRLEELGWA